MLVVDTDFNPIGTLNISCQGNSVVLYELGEMDFSTCYDDFSSCAKTSTHVFPVKTMKRSVRVSHFALEEDMRFSADATLLLTSSREKTPFCLT